VWPAVKTINESFIPNTRLMEHQLAAIQSRGYPPESELLAIICHRSNEALARGHVTVESVRAAKHRAELEAMQASTATDPELEKLTRQVDVDQRTEIDNLAAKLEKRDKDVAALQAKIETNENTIDSLKASLTAATQSSAQSGAAIPDDIRQILIRSLSDESDIADALKAIVTLHPDRLIVLDSAWKSARAATGEGLRTPTQAVRRLLGIAVRRQG
jgi:hypothetical protein